MGKIKYIGTAVLHHHITMTANGAILTKGRQILLTPTYHVFDLYKVHQDAQLIPLKFESPDYVSGSSRIPALNVSASRDSTGILHLTLVNLDPSKNISLTTNPDKSFTRVTGQVLTSANLTDINTFEKPASIRSQPFSGAKKQGEQLVIDMPAKSIVMLKVE